MGQDFGLGDGDVRWECLAGAVDDDGGAAQRSELLDDVRDRQAGLVLNCVRDRQRGGSRSSGVLRSIHGDGGRSAGQPGRAWRTVSATMRTDGLPSQTFNHAVWQTNSNLSELIHHSARGSQYLSLTCTDRLAELGIAPSVGHVARFTTTPSQRRSTPPTRPS
jgi:hypothetical protein